MTAFRPKAFAASALTLGLVAATEAPAFYCYVPQHPESPVALYEKPNDKSKVVLRMPPGSMIRSTDSIRERNGWVHVRWYKDQSAAKPGGKGWVVHEKVHGGECED